MATFLSHPDSVDAFWSRAGTKEPFPRNLVHPAERALPVRIVHLTPLELWRIERWLWRRKTSFRFNCASREVRGCLIAFAGHGLIFADSSDPVEEQRFTIAHELAHFLEDYWLVRQRAIAKFGESITEVLDGVRSPTTHERLSAVLSGYSLGPRVNLMERDKEDSTGAVWNSENHVDAVALALLAPADAVFSRVDISRTGYLERFDRTRLVLQQEFGLPSAVATSYAKSLLASIRKGPSWTERLRL